MGALQGTSAVLPLLPAGLMPAPEPRLLMPGARRLRPYSCETEEDLASLVVRQQTVRALRGGGRGVAELQEGTSAASEKTAGGVRECEWNTK